jgi:hypothetical protein
VRDGGPGGGSDTPESVSARVTVLSHFEFATCGVFATVIGNRATVLLPTIAGSTEGLLPACQSCVAEGCLDCFQRDLFTAAEAASSFQFVAREAFWVFLTRKSQVKTKGDLGIKGVMLARATGIVWLSP